MVAHGTGGSENVLYMFAVCERLTRCLTGGVSSPHFTEKEAECSGCPQAWWRLAGDVALSTWSPRYSPHPEPPGCGESWTQGPLGAERCSLSEPAHDLKEGIR